MGSIFVFIGILLAASLLASAAFQYRYAQTGSWRSHVALVVFTSVADVLLLAAYAASGRHESGAWLAVVAILVAAVAGNIMLFQGSKGGCLRPQPYYALSTAMLASTVCCAAIDNSSELRTDANVFADWAPFVIAASLMLAAAAAVVVLSRDRWRGLIGERRSRIGAIAFGAAAVMAIVSHLGPDRRSGLRVPFYPAPLDLYPTVAVFVVAGFCLCRPAIPGGRRAALAAIVTIPTLFVLTGGDIGIAIAMAAGMYAAEVGHSGRSARSLGAVLLSCLLAFMAAACLPSQTEALAAFLSSLSDGADGGRAYGSVYLFATSGIGLELGADPLGMGSGYGSLPSLAHGLGMLNLAALALAIAGMACGCRVERKRRGVGRSASFPLAVTLGVIAYSSVVCEFGAAPGYAPLPFVEFGENDLGYLAAVLALCLCSPSPDGRGGDSQGTGAPNGPGASARLGLAGWKGLALAAIAVSLLCGGLHLACTESKDLRDGGAVEALAQACVDEAGGADIAGNPLAGYAIGDSNVRSSLAKPAQPDPVDGYLLRHETRYERVVVERDYLIDNPSYEDLAANQLHETACHPVGTSIMPSVGWPIADLLEQDDFEAVVRRELGNIGEGSAAKLDALASERDEIAGVLGELDGQAELETAEIASDGEHLTFAVYRGSVTLKDGRAVDLECPVMWTGRSLEARWIYAEFSD